MKRNIFCILGYTAAGKDTMVDIISSNCKRMKKIVPITTRPMRKGEINGKDYKFIEKNDFHWYASHIIAFRSYTVWNGENWLYAFDKEDFTSSNNFIMSTDLDGYKEIRNTFPNDNVVGIFLKVPIGTLINRLEERKTPVEEIRRRLLDDISKYRDFTWGDYDHCYKYYIINNTDIKYSTRRVMEVISWENRKNMTF